MKMNFKTTKRKIVFSCVLYFFLQKFFLKKMPAHGHSAAFESRETDHVIQHVMHVHACEHAPSSVAHNCWHPQNSQIEAIKEALGQRWTRQKATEQKRLDRDNKYVMRKLELGEMRASRSMYATTHWRKDEDVSAVGTTTLNRVAQGHRIEEQNRVLFEHLLTTKCGVVTNAQLRERERRLTEKKKTMSRFKPQASYPMPDLPRAYPLVEGIEDENSKLRLPPLPSSMREGDVNSVRERGWSLSTPRDIRDASRRRDERLRLGQTMNAAAASSAGNGFVDQKLITSRTSAEHRTFDAHSWCNRESEHQKRSGNSLKKSPRYLP
jgi:hypothetical protein